MPNRDLGGLGEVEVERWALQRDIVPNRVHFDKKGWDIFLEFPQVKPRDNINYPLDLRFPEISCLVQVKATDQRIGKISRIKVTNWERMAKSPLPCFFVVLEYDGKDDVQRAYLVHVGKYWIGEILKKLRELGVSPRKQLNRCSMQLKYSDSELINKPNGASLENAIRKCIGDDPREYLMKKCEWLKNVGYDDFQSTVHFRLPKMSYDSVMETFVDFGIGVTNEISLDSLEVEEVRFGISRPFHPKIEPVNPRITVSELPPAGEADVVISDTLGNILFHDSFIYYSPGNLFPFIPFEYWKLRFTSDILSFILSIRNNRVDMNLSIFQPDKPIRLSKLSQATYFIRRGSIVKDATFKMELTIKDKTLDLDIHSSDFPPINFQLNKILSTIENAATVLDSFGPFTDLEVTQTELMGQAIHLMMMKGYLKEERLSHISSIIDSAANIDLQSLAFINCIYVLFGNKVFILSGSIQGQGKMNAEGEGYRVTIENGIGRSINKQVMSRNTFKAFSMDSFAEESFKILDEQGIQSIIMIKGQPEPTPLAGGY